MEVKLHEFNRRDQMGVQGQLCAATVPTCHWKDIRKCCSLALQLLYIAKILWKMFYKQHGVKLQEPEPDHSPPSSAEVKKMWIYTSTPPYVFMA
jgi:hypothetical protein